MHDEPSGLKSCPDCGLSKSLDEFHRHRAAPDGRQWRCKPCQNAANQRSAHARRADALVAPQSSTPLPERASELPVAFFAGFFDADGCVQIKGHRTLSLSATVTQVDPAPLLLFRERYGGAVVVRRRPSEPSRDGRDRAWIVQTAQAEAFLREVVPYLVVKYERAVLALEFRDLCKGTNRIPSVGKDLPHNRERIDWVIAERRRCAARMKDLNRKGQVKPLAQ